MEIYNYEPSSGVLIGAGVADNSPLDVDNPIVPGFATPTEPPEVGERQVARYLNGAGVPPLNWQEGAWSVAPDYRSVPLFRTADGIEFSPGAEYSGIGDLPSFLTDEPRPSTAHVWTNDEWTLDLALETEQLASAARSQRDVLLAEADRLIAPLMDGFVLDELTTEEDAKLKSLSQYRKALRAVPSQTGFPRTINWPVKPA